MVKDVKFSTGVMLAASLAASLMLSGCGSDGDSSSETTVNGVKIYTPAEISMKSNRDYNQNTYGVITAQTLNKWINDWEHNKPAGVDGRLVVLQAGRVGFDNNATFLPHNDRDVFVYGIPGGGACDPSYMRHDGYSMTPGAMVSGDRIDMNINYFQLDPNKDFVVFAVAEGSSAIREITRTWWSMVYWGWDLKHLAFLNGSVAYNYADNKDYLVSTPSTPPKMEKEYHMRDRKTDRTALHIYIDEMMDLAKIEDQSNYFIVDARGSAEYNGSKASKSLNKNCGPNHDEQCYTAYRGHVKGAVDFPYTDILVTDDGVTDLNGDGVIDKKDASYKFKEYDDLVSLYADKGYKEGDTVVAYCRTGRKSTLSALTSVTVLGYPYRMYDGSWMQWGMMAHAKDTNGTFIMPEDAAHRTDVDTYSSVLQYNDPILVNPKEIYDINLSATSAQKIKEEDKAYLGE